MDFFDDLKCFDPGKPDPSELFSLDWRESQSKAMMGNTWNKGRPIPQEQREKIRQSMLGVKHTPERRRNQSLAKLGVKHSPERNAKKSALQTGKKWYNNGEVNTFTFECPEGFVPGMLKRKK